MAPEVLAAGLPAGTTGPPRKSLSMGALKQGIAPTGPAPVHKKRPGDVDHKRDGKWNISTNFFSSDPTCVCFPGRLEPFQVAKSIDLFSYEDVSPSGIFLTFASFSFPFFFLFFSSYKCITGMQASELEPLVGGTGADTIDGVVPEGDEREEDMPDLKIAFRSEFKMTYINSS